MGWSANIYVTLHAPLCKYSCDIILLVALGNSCVLEGHSTCVLLVIVWDASMKHHFHSQTRVTAADGGHHHSICSTIRPVQSFHNSDNININHIIHRQHISRIARGGSEHTTCIGFTKLQHWRSHWTEVTLYLLTESNLLWSMLHVHVRYKHTRSHNRSNVMERSTHVWFESESITQLLTTTAASTTPSDGGVVSHTTKHDCGSS